MTAAAASLALIFPTMAFADDVHTTSVGAGGTTTITMVNGQASTTLDFYLQKNGQCDAADGSAATVSISVLGPSAMAVSPTSLVFTACHDGGDKNTQPVTFTAVQPGTYDVSTSVADTNPGDGYTNLLFHIIVNGPSNTAPTVALTGVTDGASYEFGAVPAAVCQASDTQDGNQPGTLSSTPITGPLSAYGLGSRTTTCSYTDTGGLSATPASATYSIVDTTKPVLVAPASQVINATSPAGAVATYGAPGVTEAVGLAAGSPSCAPTSGSTFPFGVPTVTCNATDVAGNAAVPVTFTITVKDDTKPTITGGGADPKEATGLLTPVDYTLPTANDDVDGLLTPVCTPASGSSFAVGSTEVSCTATDAHGNSASTTFSIVVTDTTAPDLSVADVVGVEATGPDGAAVTYDASAADLVDGSVAVTCVPVSGSTFALGLTTVSCSATDAHGNTGSATFTVEVVDTTAPELTVPDPIVVEAIAPGGNVVDFIASATDLVDTDVQVSCIPPSGSLFSVGAHTVDCTAVDDSGNQDQGSFTVTVADTTPPALTLPADITEEQTAPAGNAVSFTATATDIVDGDVPVTCVPASGSTFPRGTTTVNCSATDAHANPASGSFSVTVQDTIAPTITNLVRTPAGVDGTSPDSTGWNKTNVTYTWDCEDSGSGPVNASDSKAFSSEGAAQSFKPACADQAGNTTEGDVQTVNIDKSAPTFEFSSTPASVSYDVCTAPTQPTGSWSDPLSTVKNSTVTTSWTGPAPGALGTWEFSTQAADYATNVAQAVTRSYAVTYGAAFGGIRQPINADGSSQFKLGSTVPVKFALSCGGSPIANAVAKLAITLGTAGEAPPAGVDEAVSTSAATTGNLFRYDSSGQQYIFNLNTKAGSYQNASGTTVKFVSGQYYTLWIKLDDGTSHSVVIKLVK